MDGQRFDRMTKSLATATSRRQVLRALAAGAMSGLLTAFGSGHADAGDCKRADKPCKKDSQCCSGMCLPNGTCGCTSDVDCDDRNACTVGVCGPESHSCHHVEIGGCVECHNDHDCAGGTCCEGRCCAAGATCGRAPAGEPVCCINCEGDECCDTIQHQGAGALVISPASCVEYLPDYLDECATCESFCVSVGHCWYVPIEEGAPDRPACGCGIACVAPVSQWT